jgi:hypothetical protein
MKTSTKLLIAGGLLIALLATKAIEYKDDLMNVFPQLTPKPVKISNFKLGFSKISFNLGIKITNPTLTDINLSGFGIVSVSKVMIYKGGQLLATTTPNITSINIPNRNSVTIHDLPIEISTPTALSVLLMQDLNPTAIMNSISIKIAVNVAGNEYVIEN